MPKKRSRSQPTESKKRGLPAEHQPDDIREWIHSLPEEQKARIVEILAAEVRIKTTFIGPLPPPEDFEKYNQISPGAAERILSMAEREQQIRADGQAEIFANDKRRIHGATLLGIALIGIAGIAVWKGDIGIALPLGLAGVVGAIFRHLLDWLNARTKSER